MVGKSIVGALVIGMLIGALLLAFAEGLLSRFFAKDDVADDLETLEDGMDELDDLLTELNDTLAESHQESQLLHSELGEWVRYEEGIIAKIIGLPLLERKKQPTREELHCYNILTASQSHDTSSLDAVILEWEDKLNTLGDDAQLSNIDLQNAIQKQQQMIQLLSSISKLLHDTATTVIRKIS